MTTLLFIGDIVGPGLDYLEQNLPALIAEHHPDFIVANAENLDLPPVKGRILCGMTPDLLARLFAAGVDVATGGNHSWDGPHGREVHTAPRLLRPLNYHPAAPGRGAIIVEKGGVRLGVVNLASRDALPTANEPLQALEEQLAAWEGKTDLVLVDFHGASNEEKLSCAFATAGRITGLVGTHTHVPTLDTRVLPGGTAYVSDVGMTGPSEGILGYGPQKFVANMREGIYNESIYTYAPGPVVLGAVLITAEGGRASAIRRL